MSAPVRKCCPAPQMQPDWRWVCRRSCLGILQEHFLLTLSDGPLASMSSAIAVGEAPVYSAAGVSSAHITPTMADASRSFPVQRSLLLLHEVVCCPLARSAC